MEFDKNILPFGTTLKNYIMHTPISDAEIKKLFNKKGIFLSNYSRQNTAPLLETILLLPNDIKELLETVKEKNEKIKRFSKTFEIRKDTDLLNSLYDYNFDSEANSLNTNYEFTTQPELTVEDDTYAYNYEIKSYDKFESWGQRESHHKGAVILKLNDSKTSLIAMTEYSTPTTKIINHSILTSIKECLIKKEVMNTNVTEKYIKYDDFNDNSERVKYLLSFREINIKNIKFDNVGEIKFAPAPNEPLSGSSLEWMEDRVKQTILSGNEIDKISFFEDVKNHKVLNIESIVLEYDFNIDSTVGKLHVKIGFPDIINKTQPNTAFEFSFIDVKFSENNTKYSAQKIEKLFAQDFHQQKDFLYEELIKSRTNI